MRTVSPRIVIFKNISHFFLLFLVVICLLYGNKGMAAEADLFLLTAQIYVLYGSFRQILRSTILSLKAHKKFFFYAQELAGLQLVGS